MMNKNTESPLPKQKNISHFTIAQALVALELGSTDASILSYFNYLSNQIPVSVASFIHVLPEVPANVRFDEEVPLSISERFKLDEKILEQLKAEVEAQISPQEHQEITYSIKEGDPLEHLLWNAQELKADLLVIGQKSGHGSHGILAKNLARKTQANALIIPEKAKEALHRILIPIDFSDNSARALQTAVAINKQLSTPAQLVALHILDLPNFSTYRISRLPDQVHQMMENSHREELQKFVAKHAPEAQETIKVELVNKDMPGTAQYICDFAREQHANLLVMGAKGHSKVHLLFLGSVTEKILNLNQTIPTLIVR